MEAWQKVWSLGPWRRMWTSADQAHVHAVTGAVYMLLGAMVLADVAAVDLAKLNGGEALQVMPSEADPELLGAVRRGATADFGIFLVVFATVRGFV